MRRQFDRIGDWEQFNNMMKSYIEVPQTKYGTNLKFNDLCHYTGLRIMLWNILKYSLRLWSGAGKENDFQKIAHYSQMAWTLKQRQGRKAPFFNKDIEGDYVVPDEINITPKLEEKKISETNKTKKDNYKWEASI